MNACLGVPSRQNSPRTLFLKQRKYPLLGSAVEREASSGPVIKLKGPAVPEEEVESLPLTHLRVQRSAIVCAQTDPQGHNIVVQISL